MSSAPSTVARVCLPWACVPRHWPSATEIDLFVESPLDFEQAYHAAVGLEVTPGVEAVFAGYRDLLRLKEQAGRAMDIDDIGRLKAIDEDAGE